MPCRDYEPHLPAYALNDLPAREREAVRDHLEHCTTCREALDDLLSALDPEAWPVEPPSPELAHRTLDALRRLREESSS